MVSSSSHVETIPQSHCQDIFLTISCFKNEMQVFISSQDQAFTLFHFTLLCLVITSYTNKYFLCPFNGPSCEYGWVSCSYLITASPSHSLAGPNPGAFCHVSSYLDTQTSLWKSVEECYYASPIQLRTELRPSLFLCLP